MRTRTLLLALFLGTLPGLASGQPIAQQPVLALTNVTVIDGTGAPPTSGMTLVVEGDRILDLFPTGAKALPSNATVRDLNGHFVMPGLIDAHVHVFATAGARDSAARADFLARERARMGRALRSGVTTVRNMGGTCRPIRELARQAELGQVESPDPYFPMLVIGSEGGRTAFPGIGRLGRGCARVIDGPLDPAELVTAAKANGATGIKLYGDLSAEVAQRIAEEAHRQGLLVWAHATLFPARPSELVRGGADVVSHAGHLIWEAVDSLPAFVAAAGPAAPYAFVSPSDPAVEEVLRLMAESGTILDPTLILYNLPASAPDTANQISAADREAAGKWAADVTRRARELGVPVAAGSDAMGAEEEGSLPNLHRELELLVNEAGFSPLEAITSATSVAARTLGLETTVGTIAVGKQADLVVLRSDPTLDIRNTRDIAFVVKRGRVISGPDALAP
jgi:imidazolonepropionase-like amidohydrolase